MSEHDLPSTGLPVTVHGRLEEPLSRGLWLVKWLLLIPHYIVLFFLFIGVWVATVIAFFAILFTARFPRALFDFNLGVLRWGWRVTFYGYSALGTDKYPPFSLGAEPHYPATLDIVYPQRLSRGLVLVKWWLLALPHYMLLGIMLGGGGYTITTVTGGEVMTWSVATGSLLSLLILFAAISLLFTKRYPQGLYDFTMGVNRWALRVTAYAALLTDHYPPFRLDGGGAEPAVPFGPTPDAPGGAHAAAEPDERVPGTRPAATV